MSIIFVTIIIASVYDIIINISLVVTSAHLRNLN